MNWTEEPWNTRPHDYEGATYVTYEEYFVATTHDCVDGESCHEANALRIVACVNACAGINDPQAWIDNARFYSHETVTAITQQRDELLAALKSLSNEFVRAFPLYYYSEPWAHERNLPLQAAIAAIAAAEGREVTG